MRPQFLLSRQDNCKGPNNPKVDVPISCGRLFYCVMVRYWPYCVGQHGANRAHWVAGIGRSGRSRVKLV